MKSLLSLWTSSLLFAASAAQAGVTFAVPDAQLRALGIQTQPLKPEQKSVTLTRPAQVVVPPSADEVVSAPVAGLVTQVLAQPYQNVRAGAPLLRIVSPELGQMQMVLISASARAKLARQTFEREERLYAEEVIPQRRVQEAQAALAEANAQLLQARAALRLTGLSKSAIDGIETNSRPVGEITLSARHAGVMTEIAVKPGQRVEAASALLHIARAGTLELEIQVPAAEAGLWPAGTKIEVSGRGFTARITGASPGVSPGSQTLSLRARIEGKTAGLRPGELVAVALPAAMDGWDLPLSAVAYDGDQAHVFVRVQNGFEARPVRVLAGGGQRLRVAGELKPGEAVAVTGVVVLKGAWLKAKEGE